MIIERWVPSLVFHHQPKQTTSLDVSTKARSLDAGGPESSLPRTVASRSSTSATSGVESPGQSSTRHGHQLHGEVRLWVVEEHSAHRLR